MKKHYTNAWGAILSNSFEKEALEQVFVHSVFSLGGLGGLLGSTPTLPAARTRSLARPPAHLPWGLGLSRSRSTAHTHAAAAPATGAMFLQKRTIG